MRSSYVTRIKRRSHFSWQAQYLVNFKCHFSWQAIWCEVQVSLFVAGGVLGEVQVYFSWQAQYFVKFKCHFSWQAQYIGEGLNVRLGAKRCIFQ